MDRKLIVNGNPKSPISEAFKNMRTNIYFSNIDDAIKSIVVTSSMKSEGKSTIISNYAITLAQTGKRVLLIDSDLRRPSLHKIFDTPNTKGLINVLMKEVTWEETIQETKIDNISLLTSGPIPPNPSEMLSSNNMKELLKNLVTSFDYILMDAPPVGVVTDAVILSSIVDGTILIVAIGQTEREIFRRTIETLKNVGANIIGTVINKAPIKEGNYYYSYYYNNCYGEESKKRKRKMRA